MIQLIGRLLIVLGLWLCPCPNHEWRIREIAVEHKENSVGTIQYAWGRECSLCGEWQRRKSKENETWETVPKPEGR